MTKLYYTTTSCGAASFIAAVAAGLVIDVEQVDIKTHKTSSDADFYLVNPKGNVPALITNEGILLNEGAAVLQYIADQAPGKVAAENGTKDRYLVVNHLNYLSSELHASYGPLFGGLEGAAKDAQLKKVASKLEYIATNVLKSNNYLVGDKFSIADAYLYIILSWSGYVGVDVAAHPTIKAYSEFIGALPFVVKAHAAMATNPATTAVEATEGEETAAQTEATSTKCAPGCSIM